MRRARPEGRTPSGVAENALNLADRSAVNRGDLGDRHAVFYQDADAGKLRRRELARRLRLASRQQHPHIMSRISARPTAGSSPPASTYRPNRKWAFGPSVMGRGLTAPAAGPPRGMPRIANSLIPKIAASRVVVWSKFPSSIRLAAPWKSATPSRKRGWRLACRLGVPETAPAAAPTKPSTARGTDRRGPGATDR